MKVNGKIQRFDDVLKGLLTILSLFLSLSVQIRAVPSLFHMGGVVGSALL